MLRILHNVQIDWLAHRKPILLASALILIAGLGSAVARQASPGGTEAFNLGVDFKGGTLLTVRFKQRPSDDEIRSALAAKGVPDAQVQSTEKPDVVLVKLPRQGSEQEALAEAQVDIGGARGAEALATFGQDNAAIESTEAVGAVAGRALRNQAIAVTLLALVGVLLYIAFRFEWTYGAAAVITVFHDVLVTLGFFSVLALVVFGGDVLRGFSLALFIGIIVGTYSTVAIATPLMVWFVQKLEGREARASRPTATAGGTQQQQTGRAPANRPARARAAA